MRYFLIIGLISLILGSCDAENAPDCIQASGDLVRKEVMVPDFNKITVFEQIRLVIKQGPVQQVEIETGTNLRDEIKVAVEDDRLLIRNENGCNLFREYGVTTVYVTSPNIEEVRSSTGLPIESDGVLRYPELSLFSESFLDPTAATTDGTFDLEIDSDQLRIVVNGIAYFRFQGIADRLNITIAAGDSRIEADALQAGTVTLNHRGSNDVLIFPVRRLEGTIRGTGDVISYNRPDSIAVEELFNGRLLFREKD